MFQQRHRFSLFGIALFATLLLWAGKTEAQPLPFYKSEKILITGMWLKNITTATPPEILQYPKVGSARFTQAGGGYVLNYDNHGIAEYDTLVFSADGEIHAYALKNQFVTSEDDFHLAEAGQSFLVDVLANDDSYSDIHIQDVALSEGVTASIERGKIRIEAAEPGLYYVYYTACDGVRNCDEAKLTLLVYDDQKSRDTIVLADVLEQKLNLPLPDDSYRLVRSSAEHIFLDESSFEVHFFRQNFGKNEILFRSDRGTSLLYQIEFVNKWKRNGLNNRDRIYLHPGNSVTIDLTKNDLWKNIYQIKADHPGLNIQSLGGGLVRVEPAKDFMGKAEFSYVSCAFPRCDTAEVTVYVDHFKPAKDIFDIYVDASEPNKIPFYTPNQDYSFSIIEQPKNGQLSLIDGGRRFLFTPSSGFKGNEVARVRYLHPLSNGKNFSSDHYLRFLSSGVSVSRQCSDCVWPGDTDRNGVVDLGDLENIGRFIGEKGSARWSGDRWMGQTSYPWMNFEHNQLHHHDADGDGLISALDMLTVAKHYGKVHGLYADPVTWMDIPVEIRSSGDGVRFGEELVLEFLVGDAEHLLTGVNGFSTDLIVEGGILDTDQVEVLKDQSNWLKSYQPTLALKVAPREDQIAVGEFRVRSIGVDGHGTALKVRIIVEDEVEGFRTMRAKSKGLKFIFKNMTIHAGEDQIRLPDQILELPVKEPEMPENDEDDQVRLFPVPAGDQLNVHWFPEIEMRSADLYTMTGSLIRSYDLTSTRGGVTLDIKAVPQGMYVLKLRSDDKARVRKVSVVR